MTEKNNFEKGNSSLSNKKMKKGTSKEFMEASNVRARNCHC